MIAGLPMYDRAECRAATDAFWAGVRAHLGHGPAALSRDLDLWALWLHPDLVLAQTCGLPLRTGLAGRVSYVASPDYGLPGCPPGYYNSVIVARSDDLRPLEALATRPAINQTHSQSGARAFEGYLEDHGLELAAPLETGAHVASARVVLEGHADLACIDAQSWRLMQRYDAWTKGLREVARTAPTPATPFITRVGADPAPLRAALGAALSGLTERARAELGLAGFVDLGPEAYPPIAAAKPTPAQA